MKTLCCYTISYPFGNLERSFLSLEIKELARHFDEVVIFPSAPNGEVDQLPSNVSVDKSLSKSVGNFQKKHFMDLFQLLSSDFRGLTAAIRSGQFRRFVSESKAIVEKSIAIKRRLETLKLDPNSTVHYSYWMNEWVTSLGLLHMRIASVIVSRAHGFDLYDERSAYGLQPYRKFQLEKLSGAFTISEVGMKYLQSRYSQYRNKIRLSKLGVPKPESIPSEIVSAQFTLVSCSSLIPLKRVHLIPRILSEIKEVQINWIHIGDGPENKRVGDSLVELPSNVSVQMKGALEWNEVMAFYGSQFVDLFIHVSETEGIPVSMMEAISYGIPILACDVGGVSEVCPDSSLLIDANVDPEAIARKIEDCLLSGYTRDDDVRKKIRNFWSANYSAEQNYSSFAEEVINLR